MALDGTMASLRHTSIPINLTFHPATKRAFDLDNALAASKSAIDGIAQALGINDKQFNPVILWRGEPDKTAPRVEITIGAMDAGRT